MHDISLNQVKSLRVIMPLYNHVANHWLMKHIFLSFAREIISGMMKKCPRNVYKGHSSVLSILEKMFKVQSKLSDSSETQRD